MTSPRHISADHLRVCLVATTRSRSAAGLCQHWAAMSDGLWSVRRCDTTSALQDAPAHYLKPLVQPMHHGRVLECIERVKRTAGPDAVRTTFGAGIQALRAELSTGVL